MSTGVMTTRWARSGLTAAAVLSMALALSACGVRGPLDPPGGKVAADGTTKSAEAGAAGENSAAKPKPHEPFILDGLLR
jgi:predicted small lipoprotein YifL